MLKPFYKRINIFLIVFPLMIGSCQSPPSRDFKERTNTVTNLAKPYVVLVSIDGFRSDYTDIYSPPFLKQIRSEGSSATNLIPVYPSKTFTNHLSIITGLYAEHHEIVSNSFYDPSRKETYAISNASNVKDASWYKGAPLWVTAEKQGMLSATYFWPGSDAPIEEIRPSYYYEFNKKTALEDQTRQVVEWLSLPREKRPHFIAVYFHQVDTAGHQFGPNSKEVKAAVLEVDSALKSLNERLNKLTIPINLVIVSDHGMQAIDRSKVIFLDDFVQLNEIRAIGDGSEMMLYIDDLHKRNEIYQILKANENHFRVFKREELPARYHLSKTQRAGDLIIIPEIPYSLAKTHQTVSANLGNHGYDPDSPSMRAIFYAFGPQIKKEMKLKPFCNVHIYPFLAQILQLKIDTPIDGDSSILSPILELQKDTR